MLVTLLLLVLVTVLVLILTQLHRRNKAAEMIQEWYERLLCARAFLARARALKQVQQTHHRTSDLILELPLPFPITTAFRYHTITTSLVSS